MRIPLFVCGALAAPLLLPDAVSFAPDADATVTKTFTHSAELESVLAEVVISTADDAPSVDVSVNWSRTVEFQDTYLSSDDGRASKLRRDYGSFKHEASYEVSVEADGFNGVEENSVSGESDLEGRAVIFTREGDGVSVEWVEDKEGEDEQLAGLELDADLTGFLPQGDVAEGDRWDVDGEALVRLLLPGGDPFFELTFETEERDMEMIAVGLEPAFLTLFEDVLGDPSDAEATATYLGTRDENGRRVAVIALTVELGTEQDAIGAMDPWMDPIREDEGMDLELVMCDVEVTIEAKGELLWDLEAGRVYGLELEGDLLIAMAREVSIDLGGEQMDLTFDLELEGTLAVGLATD